MCYLLLLAALLLTSPVFGQDDYTPQELPRLPQSFGRMGSSTDMESVPTQAIVIMGGGRDLDAAFRWMIEQADGGDMVVLRAAGGNAYTPYLWKLAKGKLNSVETLLIDSREDAMDSAVAQRVQLAEVVFIAGGDQALYARYWKGTPLAGTIHFVLEEKGGIVSGTSAGAAILSGYCFEATALAPDEEGLPSEEALADPYGRRVTIGQQDFLDLHFLRRVVVDQHYMARNRMGRHLAFLARAQEMHKGPVYGIGVDEETAVIVNGVGEARVLGKGSGWFIQPDIAGAPVQLAAGKPLTWGTAARPIRVLELEADRKREYWFDVAHWYGGYRGKTFRWHDVTVTNGVLTRVPSPRQEEVEPSDW